MESLRPVKYSLLPGYQTKHRHTKYIKLIRHTTAFDMIKANINLEGAFENSKDYRNQLSYFSFAKAAFGGTSYHI